VKIFDNCGRCRYHTALWHLFDDKRLSAAGEAFINDAATARRKIAISTISLAEVVYLVEKNRLPASAYDELTQALADPEHVFTEAVISAAIVQPCGKCHAPKYRTCQTVWWRQLVSISMCRLSAVKGASAPRA
jgi:hypothetical protein